MKMINSFNGIFTVSSLESKPKDLDDFIRQRSKHVKIRHYTEDKENLREDFRHVKIDMNKAFKETKKSLINKEYVNG